MERGERLSNSSHERIRAGSGDHLTPSNTLRRRSSSKLVKHEDTAVGEGRGRGSRENGHQDYEGDEYDSASSEDDVEVPLSATANVHQSSGNHAGGGISHVSYAMDYVSSDNRSNGHGTGQLNEHGSNNHAFTAARRVSFGHHLDGNGPNGMSMASLQGSQSLHQPGMSTHPQQSQYQPHVTSHGQQPYGNSINPAYTNGVQSSHPGSFPQSQSDHHSQSQFHHQSQQPHVQSHHAESSVRFVPGFLSAVHGDTPTPSPPNGYRQGSVAQQQQNGSNEHPHLHRSHHLSIANDASGLVSNMSSLNPVSSGSRGPQSGEQPRTEMTTVSQTHSEQHQLADGRHMSESHPLSLAYAAAHGLVSSGYSISLSAPNGIDDGSAARHGQEYHRAQNQAEGHGSTDPGDAWMDNNARQGMSAQSQDQQHLRPSVVHDQGAGLIRRDYVGLDHHMSADGGASKLDNESLLIGGEDIGRDVGPGVGSANSGGTSDSLKALKMDLGEEGHDAANE